MNILESLVMYFQKIIDVIVSIFQGIFGLFGEDNT